jgi:pseudouridine-5'-phosphate glycosidase
VTPLLELLPEVADALQAAHPVVALESSVIAQGLPRPLNLETAQSVEAVIRQHGATPATIAVVNGQIKIGLTAAELALLANEPGVLKASRRDLAAAISQRRTAATTVSATMRLAHLAGIRVLATGGIGGVHRREAESLDVSADLFELATVPVCVVCSGAKSIVDIPATLEALESLGIPVIGYGTEAFPAFYVLDSGETLESRLDSPEQAAHLLATHWRLGGAGLVLAQAPPAGLALPAEEFESAFRCANSDAQAQGVKGKAVTPFLLARLAEITHGKTLAVNGALLVENAKLAAQIAIALGYETD